MRRDVGLHGRLGARALGAILSPGIRGYRAGFVQVDEGRLQDGGRGLRWHGWRRWPAM